MTGEDQMAIVRTLCDSTRDLVLGAVLRGEVPEEWDGHELRELLAELFDDARSRLMREAKRSQRRRWRDYVSARYALSRL